MSLDFSVPGKGDFQIANVLFDLNGTLACDGIIAPPTRERLVALGQVLTLTVMSADTHGTLAEVTAGLPVRMERATGTLGAEAKRAFLVQLGASTTIAMGNGRNDAAMLEAAALGIAILGPEGCAREALLAADLVFVRVDDALDALLYPARLVASLRG